MAGARVFAAVLSLLLLPILLPTLVAPAFALEAAEVGPDDVALDLLPLVELRPDEGEAITVRTVPDADGRVQTIEVTTDNPEAAGHWAVLALTNPSDEPVDRVLVAPHFRLPGSGLLAPDLGSPRIVAVTPSRGFSLDRLVNANADVFALTLEPGQTATFVAELASPDLPVLELWQPDEYEDRVNSETLYRGIILGTAGLLALFLTIVFVVRGTLMFAATAALAWVVLAFVCVDFGFLTRLLAATPLDAALWRAGVEIALAAALLAFLFGYLALARWDRRVAWLGAATLVGLAGLGALALFDASQAAGIARLALAGIAGFGALATIVLSFRGFDRAVHLVPTWALLVAWLYAAAVTVTGQLSNDFVQPALTGGLVLIVLLIALTTMQYALAGGGLQPGLISDMERRALALAGSGDAVFDWDVARDRVVTAPDISESLGLERGALVGPVREWLPYLHPDDRERFRAMLDVLVERRKGRIDEDFRLRTSHGHYHSLALRVRPVMGADGDIARLVGIIADVTDQRAAMERLLHDAVNDHLTGLPKRELFLERVETATVLARTPNAKRPTVMVIDIDRFGRVNEAFGMSAGDTILLTIARRMRRVLNPEDSLARLSGDQFAALILSESDASGLVEIERRIRETVSAPITHADSEVVLTASIGMVTWSRIEESASDLVNDAELAVFHAKRLGGDRMEPFQPSHRGEGSDRLQLEADLRRALLRREITLAYQPIVQLSDRSIAGFEALMRWEHPHRGSISPAEFIPIAERTGLISELGMFAMESAARDLRTWHRASGKEDVFVSVNVSSRQLVRQDLVDDVARVLKRTEVPAGRIKLELTESVVMDNPEQSGIVLERLKALGVGLSLDDFGTGHSALSYLGRFPFDTVKIDQSFLRREGPQKKVLLGSIVTMATGLGLDVVAEGVTGEDDADALVELGATYAQSFHFGRPVPADEAMRALSPKRPLIKR